LDLPRKRYWTVVVGSLAIRQKRSNGRGSAIFEDIWSRN